MAHFEMPVRGLRCALVSATQARGLDRDMPPLLAAFAEQGADVNVVDWDSAGVAWSAFDVVVLRSTWDYTARSAQFLDWIDAVATQTHLLNPAAIVRWNTDKHYLSDLAGAGISVVPSRYVELGDAIEPAVRRFLDEFSGARDFVVKPCIGAGSRDARRHACEDVGAAVAHVDGLLQQGRSVLLQPYLERVDSAGETALVYIDGVYSHAIRKGPLLARGGASTDQLFAPEQIDPRQPTDDERNLADRVVAVIPASGALLYSRVDLILDGNGLPLLLELELVEPSLFFAHAEGSAGRFAAAINKRVMDRQLHRIEEISD